MEDIELLKKHCIFESEFDCYMLFGIARKKDNKNITNSQEVVFREVIKESENIEKKYTKLLAQCENYRNIDNNKLNFYVYISVNSRDVRKGYLAFKQKLMQYEKEMIYGVSMSNQLKRLDSVWLSALMQPESRSRENRRFMLDIDTKDEKILTKIIEDIEKFTYITLIKETKNGWHYIVKPFDKRIGNEFSCMEVKTDALLFIKHIKQ